VILPLCIVGALTDFPVGPLRLGQMPRSILILLPGLLDVFEGRKFLLD
jgi:hypothetical protein